MVRYFPLLIALSTAHVFAHTAPSALIVKSATSAAVQLSWSGDPTATYVIERKFQGGDYSVLANAASVTAYIDKAIDPMGTYLYRVRTTAAGSTSDPSNEVIVGPPPVGLSVVSPVAPAVTNYQLYDPHQFARRPRMTLDSNGDPAFCYSIFSPGDDPQKSFLEFVAWDRVNYRWKTPVRVANIGAADPTGPSSVPFTLARDASNNTWGIAYETNFENHPVVIGLAYSRDNGITWTSVDVATEAAGGGDHPSLALGAGKVHLSFYRDFSGIQYTTGSLSDPPSKWTTVLAPLPAGANDYRSPNSLALDSNGEAAIAYWTVGDNYNSIAAFWRPKNGSAIRVTDTNEHPNDEIQVQLSFFKAQARILMEAVRDEGGTTGNDHTLWVSREEGGFPPPTPIPADGNQWLTYGSFDSGSRGQGAAAATNGGGNSDGVVCGWPKVSRSDDLLAWSSCSPYPDSSEPYKETAWPQLRFAVNDKLYIGFTNIDVDSNLGGLLLWREP